ncbi:TlpA family protein disulfide reductase [Fibrella aquatica]|uniref:TlpA family protein disulfide reductase n=1 Tax=Fibrella aquatica TaxID=3242487 RepID=UPI003522B14E
MPYYYSLALISCLLIGCSKQSTDTIQSTQLPITIKQGFGPFYPSFGILSPESPDTPVWGKLACSLTGKPRNWSRLTQTRVWLDSHQLVYQYVKSGKITLADYQFFQKEWKWTPDTSQLSATPIKCFVYIIKGFDESRGKWAIMMDTNNDLDFSNETPVYPEPIPMQPIPDKLANTRMVQYETYREGKILSAQVPLVVGLIKGDFVYGSPQYAVAAIQQGDETHDVYIASGAGRPSFESAQLCLPASVLSSGKVDPQKVVKPGEVIDIGGVPYLNRGVNMYHNRLTLETTDATAINSSHSLQVGRPFKSFSARDVSTGKLLSLTDLHGKYVYIDFWGIWCRGCIEQLPALKKVYESVDKKQVAFLGIACHNTPEQVRQFARTRHLTWPQIVSDDTNKLADRYQVTSFPTSILLDPNGIIVARNLHGEELKKKLHELTRPD